MGAQYADALRSCNKYRQIHYQFPNEVISRSMTLPRALALCAVSPKTKLDGREIDRSAPQIASNNERPPNPRRCRRAGPERSARVVRTVARLKNHGVDGLIHRPEHVVQFPIRLCTSDVG
jgi:hypothetical protein